MEWGGKVYLFQFIVSASQLMQKNYNVVILKENISSSEMNTILSNS